MPFIVPFGSFSFPPDLASEHSLLRPEILDARRVAWRTKVGHDHQAWKALLNNDAQMGAALCSKGWSPFSAGSVAPPNPTSMDLTPRVATTLSDASVWANADDLHALCVLLGGEQFWASLARSIPALALVPAHPNALWARALKRAPAQSLGLLAESFSLPPSADLDAWRDFALRDDAALAFDALAQSFSADALWHIDRERPRSILVELGSVLRAQSSRPILWTAGTESLVERILHWAREKPLTDKTPEQSISMVYHRAMSHFLALSTPDALSPAVHDARERAMRVVDSCLERYPDQVANFERNARANALESLRTETRANGDRQERRPLEAWTALGNRLRFGPSSAKGGLSLWEISVIVDNPRWMDFAQRAAGPWSWGGPWAAIEIPNPYCLLRRRDEARKRMPGLLMEKAFSSARKKIQAAPLPSAKQHDLLGVLDLPSLPESLPDGVDSEAPALFFKTALPDDVESILWKSTATPKPNLCVWLAEQSATHPALANKRWQTARRLDQIAFSRLPQSSKDTAAFYESVAESMEIRADLARHSAPNSVLSGEIPLDNPSPIKGSRRI